MLCADQTLLDFVLRNALKCEKLCDKLVEV